jgi:Dolichyl-phosphate-mannose-protein mannosyltransferase
VRRRGAALGAAAVAAATATLYVVSKGKWSDAIVDSGIEWAYADALARGDVLYRDVVYWFGPVTPHFQAAFFRLFGSSFASLALAGAVASLGVLAALWVSLRRVASSRDALLVTALAIPALVFMPNSGGAILGMGYRIWHPAAFTLLALSAASRSFARRPWLAGILAGTCAGLAGLCRAEWGLMALAGAATAFLLSRRPRPGSALAAIVVALVVFAGGIGASVLQAGRAAVLGDGHLLLRGVSPETRRFLVEFSGLPRWPQGLAELVYSAALWAGGFLVLALMLRPRGAGRRGVVLAALALVLVALGISMTLGGAAGAVAFSAAPLVGVAALVAGIVRRGRPSGAALAAYGLVGILAAHRRPFHIADGAYVGPPLLFALVGGAGLLHLAAAAGARAGDDRRRLGRGFSVALAVLVAAAFVGRAAQYLGDARVPVPGTGGMLSASPETARAISDTAAAIRESAHPGDGLVVFPEGQLFNALTGLSDPLRHQLLIPGYLTDANEPEVLAELERKAPRILLLWPRSTAEYGRPEFGRDYGRSILAWIESHYDGPIPTARRNGARLYVRREAPGSGA